MSIRHRAGVAVLAFGFWAACGSDGDTKRDPTPAPFGIEINAPGGTGDPLLVQSYSDLVGSGFTWAETGFGWGDIEERPNFFRWDVLDVHLRSARERGVSLSVAVLLLDNQTRGSLPVDLEGLWLDDPFFRSRFARFTQEVVIRGTGRIRYLWIGRESDAYLSHNLGEVASFLELIEECQDSVATIDPEVRLGTIVSYDETLARGSFVLSDRLAAAGGAIGLTVHGRDARNAQTLDPEATVERVSDAIARYAAHEVVVTEVSYPALNAADPEKQRFAEALVRLLDDSPRDLRVLFWAPLYDWNAALAEARSTELFAGEEDRLLNYARALEQSGLKRVNADPTAAWFVLRDWGVAGRERALLAP